MLDTPLVHRVHTAFPLSVILSHHAGGYFANSLAIMTDAAHMLSDFAGFLISLFAIWVSRRPPSRGMSFGWHRAGEGWGEGLVGLNFDPFISLRNKDRHNLASQHVNRRCFHIL